MSLLAVCKNHDTVCCRECFPLPQWVDIADVKDLESQLAQANKRIGEQIRDIEAMREFEENQSKKLAQSREEIENYQGMLADLQLSLRANVELAEERGIRCLKAEEEIARLIGCWTEIDRLKLDYEAKLSKLERVRVAAQKYFDNDGRNYIGGDGKVLQDALAALRETEER